MTPTATLEYGGFQATNYALSALSKRAGSLVSTLYGREEHTQGMRQGMTRRPGFHLPAFACFYGVAPAARRYQGKVSIRVGVYNRV